jgi:hypothetical protein
MGDFTTDPGYAFRLSEGQKGLDRQAAARGGLISGGALLLPYILERGLKISVFEAVKLMNKGKALVLDVRTAEVFAKGHIADAKNIDIKFSPLPTAPAYSYSTTNTDSKFLNLSDVALNYFGGVFDGFDIGRYLFGDDPRNKRGVSILRDNDSRTYLDVRKLDLFVTPEREFPYIRQPFSHSHIPVYSLHIHSKNSKLFKMNKTTEENSNYVRTSKNESTKVFIFSVFLTSAIKAVKIRMNRLMRI